MFDTTGTIFDFSVTERMETRKMLRIMEGGEGFNISDVTFELDIYNEAGERQEGTQAEHGGSTGSLLLMIPALAAGRYKYELVATDQYGEQDILLHGVLTVMTRAGLARAAEEATEANEAVLMVQIPGVVKRTLTVKWRAGSVTDEFVEEAKEAAARAEAAAKKAEGAAGIMERIEILEATVALVEGNIRSAVVINPATNTWWIGGVDTGTQATGDPGKSPRISDHNTWELWDEKTQEWYDTDSKVSGEAGKSPYVDSEGYWVDINPLTGEYRRTQLRAQGKDGVDGDTVRRIVVESEADLPSEGPTCSGGYYYYVALQDALPVAIFEAKGEQRRGASMLLNGKRVQLPTTGSGQSAAEALAENLRAVYPEAEVRAEEGAAIIRGDVKAWSVKEVNEAEWGVTLHVRMPKTGFNVYAWLESGDGSGAWACIGEANEIATAEIYGMVKLGTDVPVDGGAPVGTDAAGGMRVPAAEWLTRGSVLPGDEAMVEEGAGVGFNAEGRMMVRKADGATWGVMRHSLGRAAEVPCVGRLEDGRTGMPWATLTQPGVIKLGSTIDEHVSVPYLLGVGATENHALANNLLIGGALQHKTYTAWQREGIELTIPEAAASPMNPECYYCGLKTSDSFVQSQKNGLELAEATETRLGGVRLAASTDDSNGVWSGSLLQEYIKETVPSRESVYTKEEINKDFLTKQEAAELYPTKAKEAVLRTEQWKGNVYLTEDEYNALPSIDPQIEYSILGNSH